MGLSVLSHQAGPVHRQHHVEAVDGHVMEEHVVAALQKGGVHRKDGHRPLLGHAGGHGDGAALGDAHIEEPPGVGLSEAVQSGPPHHGRGESADAGIIPGQPHHGPAKDAGEGLSRRFFRFPCLGMEGGHAMEGVGVSLRRCKPFSLYSSYMEQDRLLQADGVAENFGQIGHVVAVHRPQVGEAHIFKHAAGQNALLQGLLYAVGHPVELPPQPEGAHHLPVPLLEAQVLGFEPLAGQMLGHRPHVLGDGHAVVIEDDQKLSPVLSPVGQALIGQAAGEGPVADEGGHYIVRPHHIPGLGHSQGHRHRVGGVSGNKGVMDALAGLRESGDASELPQSGHLLPPAGKHFVEVALVAHIEYQPVPAGVQHPVQGHRQLHRPQVGGQMSPCLGYVPDQLLPKRPAQLRRLLVTDRPQDGTAFCFIQLFLQENPSHL